MLISMSAVMTAFMADTIRKHAERSLSFATDRFQDRIRDIDVKLVDENGPRGGVDKVCRVRATLKDGPVLMAEAREEHFFGAINDAARRLRQLVSKQYSTRRVRRIDEADRRIRGHVAREIMLASCPAFHAAAQ